MRVLDRAVLAERVMVVERHLERVADRLPASLAGFRPATDTADAVLLHLWQATQIVIDTAMGACLRRFLACLSKHAEE